jgi:hypothetical protein
MTIDIVDRVELPRLADRLYFVHRITERSMRIS